MFNELFDSDICNEPTIPDPYESKLVEVKTSLIEDAGEGLFARQNVKSMNDTWLSGPFLQLSSLDRFVHRFDFCVRSL